MVATGVGSMPGEDATAYAEAVRVVLGELGGDHGLPYLPKLPGRGPHRLDDRSRRWPSSRARRGPAAGRVAAHRRRGGGPPAGPLAAGPGPRRARGAGPGPTWGPPKVQVAGPWTLAATVEKPRGDKVLADHGARRELAQALAEGMGDHVADVRRRLPGVDRLVVQVDEPALAAVLGARVPTASGFGRHRAVDLPEAAAALEWVLGAVTAAGAEPWVHRAAPGTPLGLPVGAGAEGVSVDLAVLSAADLDAGGRGRGGGPGAGAWVSSRRSTRRGADRRRRSPSRRCASWTCWASTRPRWATAWWSRRPAAWPVPSPTWARVAHTRARPGRGRNLAAAECAAPRPTGQPTWTPASGCSTAS